MKYLSVCSGIEAASVAWHELGWTPVAFSEIEPFPRAVLAHHFPGVPLHGDFTVLRDQQWIVDADLLVGGTPCQAFSVAGLRGSLADARGNLTLEFVRLANAIDDLRRAAGRAPAWIVWENVPGVLSVSDNAFGAFLGGLVGSDAAIEPPRGRGWTDAGVVHGPRRCAAWRVLDAQHFNVAQRRRRVFVLARAGAGDWSAADALLPVIESVRWHPAPRRAAGERPAPSIAARTRGGGGLGTDTGLDGGMIASTGEISHCLNAGGMGRQDLETETFVAHALRGEGFDASEDGTGRGTPLVPVHAFDARQSDVIQYGDRTGSLDTDGHSVAVAFQSSQSGVRVGDTHATLDANNGSRRHNGVVQLTEAFQQTADCLTSAYGTKWNGNASADNGSLFAQQAMQVRRLTPRECERLQGFPDDWTAIPWRGRPAAECPDGPRYKSLGNSMAVPCMRWIGQRIAASAGGERARETLEAKP